MYFGEWLLNIHNIITEFPEINEIDGYLSKMYFQSGKSQKPRATLPCGQEIFYNEAKLECMPVDLSYNMLPVEANDKLLVPLSPL